MQSTRRYGALGFASTARALGIHAAFAAAVLAGCAPALAAEADPGAPATAPTIDAAELREIDHRLAEQLGELEAQARRLSEQAQQLQDQRRLLESQRERLDRALGAEPVLGSGNVEPQSDGALAERFGRGSAPTLGLQDGSDAADKEPIGRPPTAAKPVEVAALADRGGVLTPRGVLRLEPELEFTNSEVNQFSFTGIELLDAILVGELDATQTNQNAWTSTMRAVYGVTDRFELGFKMPYVWRREGYRSDTISTPSAPTLRRDSKGEGLGDLEFDMHYQLPRPSLHAPYFVGNLRLKSTTGTGPFDLDRDSSGRETELPTGSGFWAVEPSLSVILPSEPAVLFANLSYSWNLQDDIGKTIRSNTGLVRIGSVDPGDMIGLGMGFGMAINDRTSLSIGYNHTTVLPSRTEFNGIASKSDLRQLGELQLSLSYGLNRRSSMSVALSMGVTADAPDMRLSIRSPLSWSFAD